ncbi:type II toxin-antitoxin system toxin DNA ADP-ribosyl transferase DarT [Providencia rustigianii]|uniref:type II toxin-antitoxin system toxin DNA ADP-ribosyl transferase DarT n=1 Tax=Providencia rustigianii TaxID=158850 RepID=UPI002243A34E|nr:DUF4433 domain-containing protein [Providencia rustigianii]
MSIPKEPKIYHIVHVDRLSSIFASNGLLCDAEVIFQNLSGTNIGISNIKKRRLTELQLSSHSNLYVGQCVPFYFCPRSIMLYVIHRGTNTNLTYQGGQNSIIHLQADLYDSVQWAKKHKNRWAFTLSNAGSYFFEDRCDLSQLNQLVWQDIQATQWQNCKENKQAEFLMERYFPWHLVEQIVVHSQDIQQKVIQLLRMEEHRPPVTIKSDWYY